jgi:hypothetical protein
LLSLACSSVLEIEHFDVVTVFLDADFDEVVYMYPPPGLTVDSPDGIMILCKLNRSLYGIKQQVPRSWHLPLSS